MSKLKNSIQWYSEFTKENYFKERAQGAGCHFGGFFFILFFVTGVHELHIHDLHRCMEVSGNIYFRFNGKHRKIILLDLGNPRNI